MILAFIPLITAINFNSPTNETSYPYRRTPKTLSARRLSTVTRACQQDPLPAASSLTRRELSLSALAAAAAAISLTPAAPAQAGLFGDGGEAQYQESTSKVITDALAAVALAKDAPNREDALKAVRAQTNDWVARYRRDGKFAGRPSFSNTYTALNALSGHLNSFGYTSAIPAKRLDRMVKELNDASTQLARGR